VSEAPALQQAGAIAVASGLRPLAQPPWLLAGVAWLLAAAGVTAWWLLADPHGRGVERVAVIGAIVALVVFVAARVRHERRFVVDPPLVLVVAFFAWHFPFWIVRELGGAYRYRIQEYVEYLPPLNGTALLACLAALLALAGGLQLGVGTVRWRPIAPRPAARAVYALGATGTLLVVVYFAVRGHALVGDYDAVYVGDDGPRRLLNLGMVLVLGSIVPALLYERAPRRIVAYLVLVLLPAIGLAMTMGTRWVAFTAAALVLLAASLRGLRWRLPWLVAAALLLLVASSLAREVRAGTVEALGDVPSALFPKGQTFFVGFPQEISTGSLTVKLELRSRRYDEPLWGASLLTSLATVVPSLPQLANFEVHRPAFDMAQRYYPERFETQGWTPGYSIVAELYRNFGPLGVPIGVAILAYAFGLLYARAVERESRMLLFACFAVLAFAVFGIRNDLATWVRYAIWGAGIFGALGWWLDRRAAPESA
jgi:oligosaccharide repeat unit polymerase